MYTYRDIDRYLARRNLLAHRLRIIPIIVRHARQNRLATQTHIQRTDEFGVRAKRIFLEIAHQRSTFVRISYSHVLLVDQFLADVLRSALGRRLDPSAIQGAHSILLADQLKSFGARIGHLVEANRLDESVWKRR